MDESVPNLVLSFKDVDGLTFSSACDMLVYTISDLYQQHLYLLESDSVNDYDKEIMHHIAERKATVSEIKQSLVLLTKALASYYAKPVILLLDEYDVPIAKASSNGYYDQMLEIIKGMLSTSLKDNAALRFAVITGCLRIAKESIFTGTNNFVSDTITDCRLNEYFGFTQKDVEQLLRDADAMEHSKDLKFWYDGYHFGDVDVYCPWDVMNYMRDLQYNPDVRPASYWKTPVIMLLFVLLLIMPEIPLPGNWKPCFQADILHNRLMKILLTTICILPKTISGVFFISRVI